MGREVLTASAPPVHEVRFPVNDCIGDFVIKSACMREDRLGHVKKALYYTVTRQKIDYIMKIILVGGKREASICQSLNGGPFILKVLRTMNSHGFTELVTPNYPTLAEYLTSMREKILISSFQMIAVQLGEALRYIHSQNYIHKNINANNIFLCENEARLTAFLGNFSEAAHIQETDKLTKLSNDRNEIPPEVQTGSPYSYASDVWALGICLSKVAAIIPKTGGQDQHDLEDLIAQMCKDDPKERITLDDYMNHPFVRVGECDVLISEDENLM